MIVAKKRKTKKKVKSKPKVKVKGDEKAVEAKMEVALEAKMEADAKEELVVPTVSAKEPLVVSVKEGAEEMGATVEVNVFEPEVVESNGVEVKVDLPSVVNEVLATEEQQNAPVLELKENEYAQILPLEVPQVEVVSQPVVAVDNTESKEVQEVIMNLDASQIQVVSNETQSSQPMVAAEIVTEEKEKEEKVMDIKVEKEVILTESNRTITPIMFEDPQPLSMQMNQTDTKQDMKVEVDGPLVQVHSEIESTQGSVRMSSLLEDKVSPVVRMPSLRSLTKSKLWKRDARLKLKSDELSASLVAKLLKEVKESKDKFGIECKPDPRSDFFKLVQNFRYTGRQVSAQRDLLISSNLRIKKDLKDSWKQTRRDIKQTKQTKEGNKVEHIHAYFFMEYDAKAFETTKTSMLTFSKLLSQEMTKRKHSQRMAFLRIEEYLYQLNSEAKEHQHITNRRQCLNVLFHFLNDKKSNGENTAEDQLRQRSDSTVKNEDDELALIPCLKKWIRVVTTWIYTSGSLEDQEYVFHHMLRTRGIGDWSDKLTRFSGKIQKWGSKRSWHFLKLLTLLLSPISNKAVMTPRPTNERDDWVKVDVRVSGDIKTEIAADPDKHLNLELKESDFLALINSFPVKNVVYHLMTFALSKARTLKDGKGFKIVQHAFANLKAIVRVIAGTLSGKLQLCQSFTKYLCQTLCWVTQCLVDTYDSLPNAPPLGEKLQKADVLHDAVQRELDWLTTRCLAYVNSCATNGCRFFLAEFPLRELSRTGSSMSFLVIFQDIAPEALEDSGFYTLPLDYDGWQKATDERPEIRKNFYSALRADGDFNYTLLAMTTLAAKQDVGSHIPRIWMHELFRLCFVDKNTKSHVGDVARPLVNTLCGAHPKVISQLMVDIIRFEGQQAISSSFTEIIVLISSLQMSNLVIRLGDLANLQVMLENKPNHYLAKIGKVFMSKFHYPNPSADVSPEALTSQRELLIMLAEVWVHHVVNNTHTPEDLKWFCNIICKLSTHSLSGQPLGPVLTSMPTSTCLSRYRLDDRKAEYLLGKDPIVVYASMILKHSPTESFRPEEFERLLWLLSLPVPQRHLGYCAIYSLIPSFAKIEKKRSETNSLVQRLIETNRPRGIGAIFKSDTETFTITTALQNILVAQIAGVILDSKKKFERKLFEKKGSTPGGPRDPPPSSTLDAIVHLWLSQTKEAAPQRAKTQDSAVLLAWLKDHNCRFLVNSIIRSLYVLQPVDRYNRLKALKDFFQTQIQDYIRKAAVDEKLTPSALSAFQPKLMVRYSWLTFQMLVETTLIDRPKFSLMGHQVVNQGFRKNLKQILKSIDSTKTNKLLLWESMIREWLRHAIVVEEDDPLLPLYWQGFFHLYFAKIYDKNAPSDNPNGFYGFRWLCGKSGSQLHTRALNRLEALRIYHEKKNANLKANHPLRQLTSLFRAMKLWLVKNPREIRSFLENKNAPSVAQGVVKQFIESKCPRNNEEKIIAWFLNILYFRAGCGGLSSRWCPTLLSSVILEDPFQENRQCLWFSLVDVESLRSKEKKRVMQFIPGDLFDKFYRKSPEDEKKGTTNLGSLQPPILGRKESFTRKQRLLRTSMVSQNELSPNIDTVHLTLPLSLRNPIWRLLGDNTLEIVIKNLQKYATSFEARLNKQKELGDQLGNILPSLWKNISKTTNVERKAKTRLFSNANDYTVIFKFKHTTPQQQKSVLASFNRNRAEAERVSLSSMEVSSSIRKITEDVTSTVRLLELIKQYFLKSSQTVKRSEERYKLLSTYANKWLYAIISIDSKLIRQFPPTKAVIPNIIKGLYKFIQPTYESQLKLVNTMAKHPSLTPYLVPAFSPECVFVGALTSAQLLSDDSKESSNAKYINLFTAAVGNIHVVIQGETIEMPQRVILDMFKITSWIQGKMGPSPLPHHCEQIFRGLFQLLDSAYSHKLPKKVTPGRFQDLKKEIVDCLINLIKVCLQHRFLQVFPGTLVALLKSCIVSPPRVPVSLWSAVLEAPLQRLSWTALIEAFSQLELRTHQLRVGQRFSNPAGEQRDEKGYVKLTTSGLYDITKDTHTGILGLVLKLVSASLRRLFLLRANVDSRSQAAVQREVIRKEIQLWQSFVNVMSPWLDCEIQGQAEAPWPENKSTVATAFAVSTFVKGIQYIALPVDTVFPSENKQSTKLKSPWDAKIVMTQWWTTYIEKFTLKAPLFVMNAMQDSFLDKKIANLPFGSLSLNSAMCHQINSTLESMIRNPLGHGRERAESMATFICRILEHLSWREEFFTPSKSNSSHMGDIKGTASRLYPLPGEKKAEVTKNDVLSCKSTEIVALAAHLCLLCKIPYPKGLQDLLLTLMASDWQEVAPSEYESVLVSVSELLYQTPGAPKFNSFEVQGMHFKVPRAPSTKPPASIEPVHHFFHNEKLERFPADARGRAGFILRLVLSMALPYPKYHESKTLDMGLAKLQMYTEWLLSTFHENGPHPLANFSTYVQLATQGVLYHINKNYAAIKMHCNPGTLVELLQEVTLLDHKLSEKESKKEGFNLLSHPLARVLYSSCPALTCETITACCKTIKSVKMLSADLEVTLASAIAIGSTRATEVKFRWEIAARSLSVLSEKNIESLRKACVASGHLLTLNLVHIYLLLSSAPSLALRSATLSQNEVSAGQASLKQFATSLKEAEVSTQQLQGVETRAIEHKLLMICRTIVHAQTALVKAIPNGPTAEANSTFAKLHSFLEAVSNDSRFARSKFGRFTGRILGSVGIGSSQYTPRFRLAGRCLAAFIVLRRQSSDRSSLQMFNWNEGVSSGKEKKKIQSSIEALARSRKYQNLKEKVESAAGALNDTSSQGLVGAGQFFESTVVKLFPDLEWPGSWIQHPSTNNVR